MSWHDVHRLLSPAFVKNLALASAGGAASSTTSVSAQTRAVLIQYVGSASSTGAVRFEIGNTVTATSNTSPLLFPNWPMIWKITPGQQISAISNDAGTPTLQVVELTD